ncbi:hypothetical protein [Bradyrhizobium sp. USDA 10063]
MLDHIAGAELKELTIVRNSELLGRDALRQRKLPKIVPSDCRMIKRFHMGRDND